jgi:hypothetical protein
MDSWGIVRVEKDQWSMGTETGLPCKIVDISNDRRVTWCSLDAPLAESEL